VTGVVITKKIKIVEIKIIENFEKTSKFLNPLKNKKNP